MPRTITTMTWLWTWAAALCLALACNEPGGDTGPTTTVGGDSSSVQDSNNNSNTSDPGANNTLPDTSTVAADTGPEVSVDPPIGAPPPGGKCDYVAIDQEQGKGFGEGCEKNAECAWGECLEPAEGGNITNAIFGFCTRACDCGTAETQLSSEQKASLLCIYPPGNERKWSHVVVRCNTVSDCTALDPRWTDCRLPEAGGVQRVCHADDE